MNDSLTNLDIGPLAVGNSELQINAVQSANVVNDSLTDFDLASNSVDSAEIFTDAVGAPEIAANAVGASEIGISAVGTDEVATNSLTAADLGPASVGTAEIAAITVRRRTDTLAGFDNGSFDIACPSGSTAISGGGGRGGINNTFNVLFSRPDNGTATSPANGEEFSGWAVGYHNNNAVATPVDTYVVCLG